MPSPLCEKENRGNLLQNVDDKKGDIVLLGRSGGLPAAGSRFDCRDALVGAALTSPDSSLIFT